MFRNRRCFDEQINVNNSFEFDSNFDKSMNNNFGNQMMYQNNMGMQTQAAQGCVMPTVYECPQERVCHKEIIHEVPHVCPINTRIINHHIYRHTYTPCYTCCEENVECNVYEGSCCNF